MANFSPTSGEVLTNVGRPQELAGLGILEMMFLTAMTLPQLVVLAETGVMLRENAGRPGGNSRVAIVGSLLEFTSARSSSTKQTYGSDRSFPTIL